MYKTNIKINEHHNRQKLTYPLETWILTNRDRKLIKIFERKVYRRILGPVYDNKKENCNILTSKVQFLAAERSGESS
jgi:hypothetical protein